MVKPMTRFKTTELRRKKERGEKIASITAYDLFTARLAVAAEVDFILVGDSLGNVIKGHGTTVPVRLEEVIYHTKIVVSAAPEALVLADMPFGTFKVSAERTVDNAIRLFQDTGCGGVKLEGAEACDLEAIARLTRIGVPVMGHLGLLPQAVHSTGGYRIQGKSERSRKRLLEQAQALQDAGAFAVVLECVEGNTAREITASLKVPTIGIGSGPHCDGQILVMHDALGLEAEYLPSFARKFADLFGAGLQGMESYVQSVREGSYPGAGEYTMVPREERADASDEESARLA
jgi:3-methyl-2-oxobutanoate hydroxymethyltransferase